LGLAASDLANYWESTEKDTEPYLIFEFRKPTMVTSALFVEKGNNIKKFTISYSTDAKGATDKNKVWTVIYTGGTLGDKNRGIIPLSETTAAMYKFTVTEKTGVLASLYTAALYNAPVTDAQKLAADIAALNIPKSTTANISLPMSGGYGSTFIWSSSETKYLSNGGYVTQRDNASTAVTLTLTAKYGNETKTVVYAVTVPAKIGVNGVSSGGGSVSGNGIGYIPKIEDNNAGEIPDNEKPVFADVPADFWGHDYIIGLANMGVVDKAAEYFRPDDSVTREEFIKLLVIINRLELTGEDPGFSDLDENAWYYEYVATAYKNGITNGMGDGTFGIGRVITRQDMAVMAARLPKMQAYLKTVFDKPDYGDISEISGYAAYAVEQMYALDIMTGNGGRFNPALNATRAESAKIVSLIYGLIK
jgi:hypothetical protein